MSQIHVHLIGRDPITGAAFQPAFPTNDWFWRESHSDTFLKLKHPRCIASLPAEDVNRLPEKTRTESLNQLEFILAKTDHLIDGKNPNNPVVAGEPLSYNVALRILAALAPHGIWFGALPDWRETDTWKWPRPLPEEETTPPESLKEKIVEPAEITGILESLVRHFDPIPEWEGELDIYQTIGLKIRDKTYLIPDGIPFIAVHLSEEARSYNEHEYPATIANPAFLKLMRDNPQQADQMFKTAVLDQFHYQAQSADQNYYDVDAFLRETDTEIHLLLEETLAHKKTLATATKEIEEAARRLCASYLPKIHRSLLHHDCQFHLKRLALSKTGITLQATIQTDTKTHKIQIEADGTSKTESTSRHRQPKKTKP